jgi:hypothetical protein
MRKIFAAAIATTVIAAASVAATAPASAGSFNLHIGGFGWGNPYYGGYYTPAPVYVAPAPVYTGGWQAHVNWCSNHYVTYNPATDLYFYAPGKQKHCNSPYN